MYIYIIAISMIYILTMLIIGYRHTIIMDTHTRDRGRGLWDQDSARTRRYIQLFLPSLSLIFSIVW
jgi:hypothetical protein